MKANKDLVRKLAKLFIEASSKQQEELTSISKLLELLYTLYRKERDFRGFMLNPQVPLENKVSMLKALRQRLGISEGIDKVLAYLCELNALPLLHEVKRVYDHEVEKLLSVSRAFLVLAKKVDQEEVERIKSVVKKLTGRSYEFEVVEDPSLIGGFVVRSYNFVLDASVKRLLERVAV
ncbi:MAG: hypothetical protein D6699_03295 [Aquificota bacterium]|nr:MAG: hypothetical protein D6699_03295 [Aquificota bacterium]